MKKLIMALVVVCLVGCEKSTEEMSGSFNMPEELKDCKMYSLSNGMKNVIIVRCPQSSTSTTYNCGKTTCSSMTVEVDTVGYQIRQDKKFIESIPPIGERYKVVKQEYKGKTYFVLCGIIIRKKIREIDTYFIKHYENEEEALEGANILNKKDIEEHELKEMEKYFENNI